MMMIIDHSLSTEVPLDLHQSAEKGLDHDGPHRPTTTGNNFSCSRRGRLCYLSHIIGPGLTRILTRAITPYIYPP
jgi:hypothetical protein